MAAEYTPEHVARGLRDLIAWETRYKPAVEIWEMHDGYEARVTLSAAAKTDTLEQHLRDLLPDGYTLTITWT